MKPAIEYHKKGPFRMLALNKDARKCIGLNRILYGWGVLIDNKAAFARTVAPGMLSAARWGESAAESVAEQWRKDEATEAKKEHLSELRSETMHMENAIRNYQAKIDELRARQRKVDDEIMTIEEELEP